MLFRGKDYKRYIEWTAKSDDPFVIRQRIYTFRIVTPLEAIVASCPPEIDFSGLWQNCPKISLVLCDQITEWTQKLNCLETVQVEKILKLLTKRTYKH